MKKIFLSLLCLFMITGCGKKDPEITENNEPEQPVEKKVQIIDVDSNTRPYAVMINCHNGALPQAGLDNAYIVYEIMVEGGITRMMALFKDADVSKIGSVRSARIQFLDYVYENDAIYAHAGGSQDALSQISNERISDVDVDGKYGMRDRTLNRATEHTLFTSTSLLAKGSASKSLRTTTDVGNLLNYSAEEIDLSKYESAIKATDVSIRYSSYRTSIYKYDEENKNYLRYMNNTANTDLVTNKQYTAKNIIVYSITYIPYTLPSYSGTYQRLDNIGSGEGYYISDGYAVPITWEKSSKTSKTIYKIKETGENLVVNDGNTYIQIQPKGQNLSIN